MHPVPPLEDLAWLLGDRLDVISTAQFTMSFTFDSGGIIQSSETVDLAQKDGNFQSYNPETREGCWPFHKIIGSLVKHVSRPSDWSLEIQFVNHVRLIVRSRGGFYESGAMTMPGREGQLGYFF